MNIFLYKITHNLYMKMVPLLLLLLLPMIVYDAYALGTPHPISTPSPLLINYMAILLAVVFYIFLKYLIRRSFHSRYRLTP